MRAPSCIWLTGPPASGKTTVASRLVERLGPHAVLLDSDALREVLTPDASYTASERDAFYAKLAGLAAMLWRSGLVVVIAATASKRRYRDALREEVAPFLEVLIHAPDHVLEARDPKGLYAAAKAGRIEHLPGRGADYERPTAPELTFDTSRTDVDTIAEGILAAIECDAAAAKGDIRPEEVERYLRRHGHPGAVLTAMTPLGDEVQEGLKAHGYGHPLRLSFTQDGASHDLTLRTVAADPFGHDRRADRFDNLVLAYDEFGHYPRHIVPRDVGVVTEGGALESIGGGEPFLITTYVDGELYAHDLKRLEHEDEPTPLDRVRAAALATYLAELHAEPQPASKRRRATRDLVGHGEGIFGLVDAFEPNDPIATASRLRKIEHDAIDWLWRLRERDDRSRRTHGDFHPFNLLFRGGDDFTVLDASRGGAGDPADDVTALAINYVFFAMAATGRFEGALRVLWDHFWSTYLEKSGDDEVLKMVAPYFAWRALVLVCPAWYPDLDANVRDRLLRFAERLLGGAQFTPDAIDRLLD